MAQTFRLPGNWPLILRELGIKPGNVLARSGLPADLLAREGAQITEEQYFKLCESLAAEMGDRPVGLEVGQGIAIEAFDPAIFAALSSPNFKHAAERLSKYKKLIGPIKLNILESEEQFSLQFTGLGAKQLPDSIGLTELVFMVHFCRMATRKTINPIRVTVPNLPKAIDLYEDFFGVRVIRDDHFTVIFARADTSIPFLTANAESWRFFEPILNDRIAEIDQAASTVDRVYAILCELLPAGRNSVQDVASKLGLSTRSLQRRLKEEQTTFNKVLSSTREQLARHYLTNSALTAAEISFLLGFDEPNSFFRAFRSWTGESPQRFRTSAA